MDDYDELLDAVEYDYLASLGISQSYTTSRRIRLPDGIDSDFYLLVFTDDTSSDNTWPIMGVVEEFQNEGNNIASAYMPVDLTPPPDLQVTTVTIPQEVLDEQSISLGKRVHPFSIGGVDKKRVLAIRGLTDFPELNEPALKKTEANFGL